MRPFANAILGGVSVLPPRLAFSASGWVWFVCRVPVLVLVEGLVLWHVPPTPSNAIKGRGVDEHGPRTHHTTRLMMTGEHEDLAYDARARYRAERA